MSYMHTFAAFAPDLIASALTASPLTATAAYAARLSSPDVELSSPMVAQAKMSRTAQLRLLGQTTTDFADERHMEVLSGSG